MTLATIVAVFLLSTSPTTASAPAIPPGQAGSSSQEPTAQPPSAPAQASPDQASPDHLKPAPKPHHRKKKTVNCTTAAPAPNSAQNPAASTPCPPPKKVVRHGGSEEPAVQVTGGTTAEQASNQRSTEQLKLATEENLKKVEGRQLNPSQQEMVSQIQQFMEQSKTAVAAGDLDRAHSLGLKAYLLSDELVKP